jgi:solute carrier family 25 aspartate/glutamate transporter 12/13
MRHAQKDENGDLYMGREDFINAIAPKQEDYVSQPPVEKQQHH